MELAQTLGSVVSVFGIVAGASPAFQIARVVRRRRSADISTVQLGIVVIGTLLWLAYGLSIHNFALVATNAVASSVNAAALVTALYFRREEPAGLVETSGESDGRGPLRSLRTATDIHRSN